MKSKMLKIFGVVAIIATLAATLVAAPTMALSQPSVSMAAFDVNNAAGVISAKNVYTVSFTAGAPVAAGGHIVIQFPAGTNISSISNLANGDVTVAALAGIGGGPINPAVPATSSISGAYPAAQTLTITLPVGSSIGTGSLVAVTIGSIANNDAVVNPTSAGSQTTLTVSTTNNVGTVIEAAVTAAPYSITNPTIGALPGVAKLYNSANILIQHSNSIAAVLALASTSTSSTPYTITLTAGTYAESDVVAFPYVTIKADTGVDPSTVILQPQAPAPGGTIINADHVTVSNVTIDSSVGSFTVGAGATNFTLSNVTFLAQPTTGTINTNYTLLGVNAAATPGTITGCTFNVTGVYTTLGISAQALNTISSSTFNVDAGGTAISDTTAGANLTISKITVAGTTGIGFSATTGTSTIDSSKFTNLDQAIVFSGTELGVTNNTIDTCGNATNLTPAIAINNPVANPWVFVSSNKLTNSPYYVATVPVADAAQVFFVLNDLSGSVKAFNNVSAVSTSTAIDATNNFWGSVDPTSSSVNSVAVNYTPKLSAAPGAGTANNVVGGVGVTTNSITNATIGATVAIVTSAAVPQTANMVAVAAYAANPVPSIALPTGVSALQSFFDVLVSSGQATATTDNAVITLSGTTAKPITADSVVCMYNATTGTWSVVPTSAANPFANTIQATVAVNQLGGTPFAIAVKPSVPANVVVADATPAQGAINVDPTNVNFTWDAVTVSATGTTSGATGYNFALANADEQTGNSHFGVLAYSAKTDINAATVAIALKYDATYYWEVQPYNAAGTGAWTVFVFKTEAQPTTTTAAPPVTVTQTQVTITQPQATSTQVIVTAPPSPAPVQAIPSYLIWAVIAVGAILIIVVIVLIVRTRRIG